MSKFELSKASQWLETWVDMAGASVHHPVNVPTGSQWLETWVDMAGQTQDEGAILTGIGRNGWRPGWTWQELILHALVEAEVVAMAGDLAGCSVRGSEKTPPRHRFSSMLKNVHVFQHP